MYQEYDQFREEKKNIIVKKSISFYYSKFNIFYFQKHIENLLFLRYT